MNSGRRRTAPAWPGPTREHLSVGDTFQLLTNDQTRVFRVSAIYETGVEDIDKVRVFLKMGLARSLL